MTNHHQTDVFFGHLFGTWLQPKTIKWILNINCNFMQSESTWFLSVNIEKRLIKLHKKIYRISLHEDFGWSFLLLFFGWFRWDFFSVISHNNIPHLIKSKTHQTLIKTSIPLLFSSASLSNTIHRKKNPNASHSTWWPGTHLIQLKS
jgi:hypothetical protein